MAIEKTIILNVETEGAVENIQEVDKSIDSVSDSTQDLTNAFDRMTGGLVTGFRGVVKGAKSGVVAMRSLKVAIAATGVGLLVIAIGTLVAAFASTQRGADKLQSILTPLAIVFERIWGVVQNLSTIFADILGGDGEWDDLATAIGGVGDELREAWEQGVRLHELNILIQEDNLNLITATAKLNRQIAEQKLIAEDTTRAYKERETALLLVLESEEAVATIALAALNNRIIAEELRLKQSTNQREDLTELITLEAARDDALGRQAERQKEAQNQLNALRRSVEGEREVDINEKVNPITGVTTNELDQIITDQNDLILERGEQLTEALEEQRLNRLRGLNSETDARIQLQSDIVDASQNTLNALSVIGGQETALGKALIITKQVAAATEIAIGISKLQFKATETVAEAAMDGAKATTSVATGAAVTLSAGFPAAIPLLIGYAAAAVGIVASIVQATKTSKQVAAKFGGTGPSIETPQVPTAPQFNIVGTAPENQLANTIADQQQQPIEAFVVANNVTTQQALDRNKVETASFG